MRIPRRLALTMAALAPIAALGQTPTASPKPFQTRTLARIAVGLKSVGGSLDVKRRSGATEVLRYANQEISYVVGGSLPAPEKKAKILALQESLAAKLANLLPAPVFGRLAAAAGKLDEKAVLNRVRVFALSVGDDPFGRTNRYIGETEKNFAQTDALGGNALPSQLAQASLGSEFRPARKR